MSQQIEQIQQYIAIQHYSAEIQEQAHKTNLMDDQNPSHHNLDFLPQVITFHRRILCFQMRELNVQPSLSVGNTALPPANASLPVLIRQPPWDPSHKRSLKSWGPKTAIMECILTL
jgi:hypothetical protein